MSLDRISLAGLRVFARHGVREHERQDGWCGWPAGRRCG